MHGWIDVGRERRLPQARTDTAKVNAVANVTEIRKVSGVLYSSLQMTTKVSTNHLDCGTDRHGPLSALIADSPASRSLKTSVSV